MGRSVAGKGRFDGRRVEGEAGYKEVRGGKTFEGDIDEEGEAVFEGRVEEGQRRRLAPFVASSSFLLLLRLLFLSFIHADTRADPSPVPRRIPCTEGDHTARPYSASCLVHDFRLDEAVRPSNSLVAGTSLSSSLPRAAARLFHRRLQTCVSPHPISSFLSSLSWLGRQRVLFSRQGEKVGERGNVVDINWDGNSADSLQFHSKSIPLE